MGLAFFGISDDSVRNPSDCARTGNAHRCIFRRFPSRPGQANQRAAQCKKTIAAALEFAALPRPSAMTTHARPPSPSPSIISPLPVSCTIGPETDSLLSAYKRDEPQVRRGTIDGIVAPVRASLRVTTVEPAPDHHRTRHAAAPLHCKSHDGADGDDQVPPPSTATPSASRGETECQLTVRYPRHPPAPR